MDSQLFFIINLIVAVLMLWWFLSWRSRKNNVSSLDLKKGSLFRPDESEELGSIETATESARYKNLDLNKLKAIRKSNTAAEVNAKNLNVLFMYNGHDWDAYEVLGVPAGCNIKLVTQRYQELIRGADEGKLLFYQAAYDAILKKQ